MRTDVFDYDLPPERIAQTPLPRGESRLLVLHRDGCPIEHRRFPDLLRYLRPDDTLVLNDTRVVARRLRARVLGPDGRDCDVELLALRRAGERGWAVLAKPGRRLKCGARIEIPLSGGGSAEAAVTGSTPEGGRILEFSSADVRDRIAREGEPPLPPYIHEPLADESRYQTVYAAQGESAAAPTAGLHFTEAMLAQIEELGLEVARITLDVGVDTFRPVRTESMEEHVMHGENFAISPEAAEIINRALDRGSRVIAVGTTVVRALESAGQGGRVKPGQAKTRLFIQPGHRYRVIGGLLTNFHLPRSTLLALVSAFAGVEPVMAAYREAVREGYRFYSFGDAMLVI